MLIHGLLATCVLLPSCSFAFGSTSSNDPAVGFLANEVRDKGWIVYGARSTNGDYELFLCRPDGSGISPITRTPQFSEFSPQVSPDGKRMLYRRVPRVEQLDNNRHGEQGELILANSDGSVPVVLGKTGELSWASFSPDGTQIASLSIKGIAFFSLDRREVVRTLPRKGFFQQVTWSPDGKWLCGVANSFGASWSIARMDLSTGEAAAVNRIDCCTPDWFPDSQNLIFSWRPPGQKTNKGYGWTQLWRASADGASRQLVYAEEGRHVYGGNVSPDGKYVLFTGNMQEDGDPGRAGAPMSLMRLDDAPIIAGVSREFRGAHPEATNNGPVLTLPSGWEPFWTKAEIGANRVSGVEDDSSGELVRMRAALHDLGKVVFSARSKAGDWDLFEMKPDGTDRRPITQTVEFNEAGARFSRDGKRLLYYRMPKSEPVDNNNYGTFDLVIANADGTAPMVYGREYQWASWGPDGRQIACLAPDGIRLIDAGTRALIRKLPRRGIVSQLVWSPDGRFFTGTANGLGQFWNIGCLDAATGEIRVVSETERYNCTSDWMPDSRHLVYARGIIPQQAGRAELWVTDITGRNKERLYAESERHIYGACASPDGRFLIFTRSFEDLGKASEIEMAIISWPKRTGEQRDSGSPGPRLDLGFGWEPDWNIAK